MSRHNSRKFNGKRINTSLVEAVKEKNVGYCKKGRLLVIQSRIASHSCWEYGDDHTITDYTF